jgi:hypothetical protein
MEKQIVKVYSGKNGKCMCGCAGKYSYTAYGASEHSPGYDVSDAVNERSVKTISKKVLSASNKEVDGDVVYAVEGDRIRVVYFA